MTFDLTQIGISGAPNSFYYQDQYSPPQQRHFAGSGNSHCTHLHSVLQCSRRPLCRASYTSSDRICKLTPNSTGTFPAGLFLSRMIFTDLTLQCSMWMRLFILKWCQLWRDGYRRPARKVFNSDLSWQNQSCDFVCDMTPTDQQVAADFFRTMSSHGQRPDPASKASYHRSRVRSAVMTPSRKQRQEQNAAKTAFHQLSRYECRYRYTLAMSSVTHCEDLTSVLLGAQP